MLKKLSIKYEHKFDRIFRILPGFAIWAILLSPVWMSQSYPEAIANFIIVFAVYWLYRALIFCIGLVIGYQRYKKEIQVDWLSECKSLDVSLLHDKDTLPKNSILPKHLIVIPVGGAKYQTLEHTLNAIKNQNYPLNLIYVSLSFEERLIEKDPDYYTKMQNDLRKNFGCFADRLMIFNHPKDLPGEAIGAAANRTWGNKKAIEVLEKNGENISDFLTTSPDEDIRFHKEYLAAVSYKYLTAEKRIQKFYQTALYLFHNNYWEIPMLIRAWAMSLTLPVLSSSVTQLRERDTWSCYSVNLEVLRKVNYWDTSIGIDDTPFYWRPFDYFNGDFECEAFFVPLYADSVYHPNKKENYKAQYKQLVRWGWGVVAFPIAMKVLFQNNKIPLLTKLRKFYVMFEMIVLFKLAAILFTFGLPVLGLLNPTFSESAIFTYSLPKTLEAIMFMLTFMMIPTATYKLLLMPKLPDGINKIKFAFKFLIELLLHVVILYSYAFFPFLVGPTKMMLGKNYSFVVTEKK